MKKKERERGKEGGAGHRECLFLANLFLLFPSFCLFFLFFEPLFGENFFSFFCAKNVFRVTKRVVFFSSGVGRGEGVHFFFCRFGVKRLFVCILFFFSTKTHSF